MEPAGTSVAALELSAALDGAGISLRPVVEADLAFLCHLYRSNRWEELSVLPWPDEAKRSFLDQQFSFQQRHFTMAFPKAEYYLILRQGEPIGRLYLDRADRTLHLVEIGLLSEWRQQGLGAALLDALQHEVRDGRADQVILSVLGTSPARQLYARCGFIEIVTDEEFPSPHIEMRWPAAR